MEMDRIGKVGILIALAGEEEQPGLIQAAKDKGYKVAVGRAGSMDFRKIMEAIETAAVNKGLIVRSEWEVHALYHATMEALHGIGRGQMELGSLMRTLGVQFAVVRGKRFEGPKERNWVSVAIYGTIGAPIKGLEHEVFGFGVNHIT